jgi:hypothetical protein
MRWFIYASALAIASVWQITCWTSPGFLLYAVSWPVTAVACVFLEVALFGALIGNPTDEEERMRRRLALSLYPVALLVPVVPFWEYVVPVLGAIAALRFFRRGLLRHVVPSTLGVTALVAAVMLAPWSAGLDVDALFGWSVALVAFLLLSYQAWLWRRAVTSGRMTDASPDKRRGDPTLRTR